MRGNWKEAEKNDCELNTKHWRTRRTHKNMKKRCGLALAELSSSQQPHTKNHNNKKIGNRICPKRLHKCSFDLNATANRLQTSADWRHALWDSETTRRWRNAFQANTPVFNTKARNAVSLENLRTDSMPCKKSTPLRKPWAIMKYTYYQKVVTFQIKRRKHASAVTTMVTSCSEPEWWSRYYSNSCDKCVPIRALVRKRGRWNTSISQFGITCQKPEKRFNFALGISSKCDRNSCSIFLIVVLVFPIKFINYLQVFMHLVWID